VVLAWAAVAGLGQLVEPAALLALAVVGGLPIGLVALLLGGVLLRTSGAWLGGRAGAGRVRAALCWAVAPVAGGTFLWGLQLALLPAASFGGAAGGIELLLVRICAFVHVLLWLWAALRGVRSLAAAHGFGAGRATAAWLLAVILVAAFSISILGVAALAIGLRGG
jgi:hypothetical protein